MVTKQVLIILLSAAIISVAVNVVSPNSIPLVGSYRTLSTGSGPVIPPTAGKGDPPFIDINAAQFEFSAGVALFVDAREPEEFECGTIPGSISIPFDYLPEEDPAGYIDSALSGDAKDRQIIVFCSGEECDLSLHLARNMQDFGYTNLSIFFGGAREWKNFDLELERRRKCDE